MISELILILPVGFIFTTDATGIVVAEDKMPEVRVVVIPFAFPSDGDLNNVYSF